MSHSYFRTFIGIPVRVEASFIRRLESLKTRLSGERISWVPPERFHLTLRFLGDTDPQSIKEISNGLRNRKDWPHSSEAELAEWGVFGPRRRPRVVWAGFGDPGYFITLKRVVDEILEGAGMPSGGGAFTPHLTLGRIRSLKDPGKVHSALSEIPFPDGETTPVEEVVFYRSILKDKGPEYVPLERTGLP